jgi:membrane complex biogenesis BtpA family protein
MSLLDHQNKFPDSSLIAMIGLMPLPDSPGYGGSEEAVVNRALEDCEIYSRAGVDALLIENSGDLPYVKPPLSDQAVQLVEHISRLIRMRFKKPIGLQLLEAANEQAMLVAANTGLNFIRAEGYVFAHVGGAGLIEGSAGKILRLRKSLKAESIQVFADVRKKHCSHALTGDLDISEHVRQADFFHADGIIVTGPRTGAEPDLSDLERCQAASQLPVLIGSGMDTGNLDKYFAFADGFIVGSTFRKKGRFLEKLCPDRLEVFVEEFRRLKSAACTG